MTRGGCVNDRALILTELLSSQSSVALRTSRKMLGLLGRVSRHRFKCSLQSL
jgi:RNase P/RNase MRP subunit p29